MKQNKSRPQYTVVLHPKKGYNACGYGFPGRAWRGNKKFSRLPDALKWTEKVRLSLGKRKRPWDSFQVIQSKDYGNVETLVIGHFTKHYSYNN